MDIITPMLDNEGFNLLLEYQNYMDNITDARYDRLNKRKEIFDKNKDIVCNRIKSELSYQGDNPENVIDACLFLAANAPGATGLIYNIIKILATKDFTIDRLTWVLGSMAMIAIPHILQKRRNKEYRGYIKEFEYNLNIIYTSLLSYLRKNN